MFSDWEVRTLVHCDGPCIILVNFHENGLMLVS